MNMLDDEEFNYEILNYKESKDFVLAELSKKFPNTIFIIKKEGGRPNVYYVDGPAERTVDEFCLEFYKSYRNCELKLKNYININGELCKLSDNFGFPTRLFSERGLDEFKAAVDCESKECGVNLWESIRIKKSLNIPKCFEVYARFSGEENLNFGLSLHSILKKFVCKGSIVNNFNNRSELIAA